MAVHKEDRIDVLFSTMTRVETELWVEVAERLRDQGLRPAFLLFDESARDLVTSKDIECHSVFELMDEAPLGVVTPELEDEACRRYGIANIRHTFIHEKLGYGRPDEAELTRKMLHFLQVIDQLLKRRPARCVVQEMGGFAACHAVFFAARANGVDHVFYEPAPIAGRLAFTRNGFYADIPKAIMDAAPPPHALAKARAIREAYLTKPSYTIPKKDRHSFRDMTASRMFNLFNARRLSGKLYNKYVGGKREEFDEVGFVVRKNLLKLARRKLLASWYSDPQESERYVYYPFHVPHDVQLSVRSKLFYGQEGFVEYLSRLLPPGYKLYVKEHPAAIGGHSARTLKSLLRLHPSIRLIHPRHNSFALIKNAAAVVTVNSKVGYEAVLQGQKVVVAGQAFYRGKGLTFDVDNLNDLETVVTRAIGSNGPSESQIFEFLARVYQWTSPGELFDPRPENADQCYESLQGFLVHEGILQRPRQVVAAEAY